MDIKKIKKGSAGVIFVNFYHFLCNIISFLLNPIFYLGTVFIALIINSLFTNNAEKLPHAIAYLIEHRPYAIAFIVFWGLFSVLKLNYDKNYDDIKKKDEQISQLTRQIEISSGMIEARYGEFAEKIHEENILKIFKDAINHFSILEAVHLYKYNLQKVNNNIEIKVKFFMGKEQERICLNVIKQHYYEIDKNIFLRLTKLKEEEGDFLKTIGEIFQDISKSNMDEAMKQKLIEILVRYLNMYAGDKNKGLIPKGESDKYIRSKCAMVVPVVINNGYMFQYYGENKRKQGRIYFTTQVSLDNDYILNLILDGTDFNFERLEKYFNNVVEYIKNQYSVVINN